MEDTRSCHEQLDAVEEQLYLASEKVASVEVTSAGAAGRTNGELARVQKECDLGGRRTAIAKSAAKVLHMELEVVRVMVRDLERENAILRKELKLLSKAHEETKVGFSRDPSETCDDLGKNTMQCY